MHLGQLELGRSPHSWRKAQVANDVTEGLSRVRGSAHSLHLKAKPSKVNCALKESHRVLIMKRCPFIPLRFVLRKDLSFGMVSQNLDIDKTT